MNTTMMILVAQTNLMFRSISEDAKKATDFANFEGTSPKAHRAAAAAHRALAVAADHRNAPDIARAAREQARTHEHLASCYE